MTCRASRHPLFCSTSTARTVRPFPHLSLLTPISGALTATPRLSIGKAVSVRVANSVVEVLEDSSVITHAAASRLHKQIHESPTPGNLAAHKRSLSYGSHTHTHRISTTTYARQSLSQRTHTFTHTLTQPPTHTLTHSLTQPPTHHPIQAYHSLGQRLPRSAATPLVVPTAATPPSHPEGDVQPL